MGFLIPPTHTPITHYSDSKVISYYIPPSVCRVPHPKNYFHGKMGLQKVPPIHSVAQVCVCAFNLC